MNGLAVSASALPALAVALSFAAGLNVYATLLTLGVMARLHWLNLPPSLGPVDHWWMIGLSGFLFLGEFVADKIPGFDVIWNLMHTFIRVPAAALLAFAASSQLPLWMQVGVAMVGAAFAAVAHGGKTALRVAVTPSPEPFSNAALSMSEDAAAVGLSWVAVRHPIAGGVAASLAVLLMVGLGWWGMRAIRRGWNRRFKDRRRDAGSDGLRPETFSGPSAIS